MSKYRGRVEKWGTFVDIKTNAAELLYRELPKTYRKRIIISSVTDPYQPIEEKEKITRRILKLLISSHASICILTKSSLIIRDIDLLLEFPSIEVGFSLTLLGDRYRLFEPFASPPKNRFETLEKLSSHGIHTFIFMAPLLPGFSDTRANLEMIFNNAAESGCREIFIDRLSLYSYVRNNLYKLYKLAFPEKLKFLIEYDRHRKHYLKKFKEIILEAAYRLHIERTLKIKFFF